MSDFKYLYETLPEIMRKYRLQYSDIPQYITDNIKYDLYKWQKEALEYFLDFQQIKKIENPNTATHLLFNMATGTGKTLVMASAILYYYKQGYRNFIFFVNQNNIVGKTEENLLNTEHNKYLYKNPIVIDDKIVNIKKVDTFSDQTDDIEIIFTSIHKLHNAIYQVRENSIFLEDLQKRDIVMLADEAHHLNADTISNKQTELELITELKENASQKEIEKSWEHTVTNLILQKGNKNSSTPNKNVLLEFTATVPKNTNVIKKYQDKIIYKFELKDFLNAGYTKEINLVSSSFYRKQRILQALLFNWYRYKIGIKYDIPHFKPVILFRSKYIDKKDESNIEDDYAFFRDIIDNLKIKDFDFLKKIKVEQSKEIYKIGQSRIKDIATYIKNKDIHFSEIITYMQDTFKDSRCIITHSKDKKLAKGRYGEDKTTPEQDKLLNSLEDKTNKITAIFTVKRLTEGWDVLNLFDIVRMYEGRDTGATKSGKRKAGASTVSEVQLIGRGVRYYPFKYKDMPPNKRKFDKDLKHELRVLEEFYFHSNNDEKYINELKDELKRQKLLPKKDKQPKLFDIKDEFKKDKNSFYHKIKIYKNDVIDNPHRRKRTLKELQDEWNFEYNIKPISIKETQINLDKEDITKYSTDNNEGRVINFELKDFPKHIIFKALNIQAKKEKSIFRFENLKKELKIDSIDEILEDNFLGKFKLFIFIKGYGNEFSNLKTEQEKKEKFFDLIEPKILLDLLSNFFKNLAIELKKISNPKIGTEFKPVPMSYVFNEPKQISVEEDTESYELEKELKEKDWYVVNSFYGTSEEKNLIRFLKDRMDNFKDEYDEVYLIRNEEVYKIYNFKDGKGFMPDFILFLKKENKELYYQVFIEPKGEHLMEKDEWKNDFLKEITDKYGKDNILKTENKEYILIGLPLYNADIPNPFKQSIKDNLNIEIDANA